MNPVFTIGHSNQQLDTFLHCLQQHGITAVADVRSRPYSRHVPHFSREPLQAALEAAGIAYVFLGNELGARPDNPDLYDQAPDGKVRVNTDRLTRQTGFEGGLDRLREGASRYRVAILCAEKDPANCHRGRLVAPRLASQGMEVIHIHTDGGLEAHADLEARLPGNEKGPTPDLFE